MKKYEHTNNNNYNNNNDNQNSKTSLCFIEKRIDSFSNFHTHKSTHTPSLSKIMRGFRHESQTDVAYAMTLQGTSRKLISNNKAA